LTPGTAYTFTVVATNVAGDGAPSAASAAVTVGAPVAPGSASAVGGTGQATVTWVVPTTDNGSAIVQYTVTPFKNGVAQTPVDVPGPSATSVIVTSLTADPNYTFEVTATNGVGTSLAATTGSVAVS
jgi:hypothetical protein